MVSRGVLFAIDDDDLARLGDAANDAEVLAIVAELEERWDPRWTCELDKSAETIHRAISGGGFSPGAGAFPERLAVLGARSIIDADEPYVSVNAPDDVARVARALARWDRARFRAGYQAIDRSEYGDLDDEDLEYAWSYFEPMRELYVAAAREERAVVFSA